MRMNKGVTADDLLRASALEAMEARILLAHALGWRRTELMTRAHEKLEPTQADTFRRLEQRRDHGEPMAYLVGKREFFGLDFRRNCVSASRGIDHRNRRFAARARAGCAERAAPVVRRPPRRGAALHRRRLVSSFNRSYYPVRCDCQQSALFGGG